MENQVWLHHKYVDKNKTLLSLVQSKGSLSSFTHFKTRQTLFNKSHETAVIVDLNKKLVTFQSGFDSQIAKVLESKGLAEFMNHCHNDDKDLVKHICKNYLGYCLENVLAPSTTSLNLTCRVQIETGKVVKLLCQIKVFEFHEQQISKLLINLTNISFLSTQSPVAWILKADTEQQVKFKKRVAKKYMKLFTPREMDIIKQIQNGFSNVKIGDKLFISDKTVATHRKRILKKSKCHSANELVAYCMQRGIL